MMIKAAAV